MQNIILSFILLLSPVLSLMGQDWNEVKAHPKLYITAEGFGKSVDEADREALEGLVGRIGMSITSRFESIEVQGRESSAEMLDSRLSTYSFASLSGTGMAVLSRRPQAHVVRWVGVGEVERLLEQRRDRVREYVGCAARAEDDLKIGDALRSYSWALALLQTLPDGQGMTVGTDQGDRQAAVWITEQMNRMFDGLQAGIIGLDGGLLSLSFTYGGRKVSSLDFMAFDGTGWSGLCSVKDGLGVVDCMSGQCPESVQIRYEYAYAGEAHVDREVGDAIQALGIAPMRKSYSTATRSASRRGWNRDAEIGGRVRGRVASAMEAIIAGLESGEVSTLEEHCTPGGYDMIRRVMDYGEMTVLDKGDLRMVRTRCGDVSVRGVTASFSFGEGMRERFQEKLVFTFGPDLLVSSISFALESRTARDIYGRKAWSEDARMRIIEFLEDFRTAYALKRLDYIRGVFDDDAVIIVGKVAMSTPGRGTDGPQLRLPAVQRTRYSKDQYMVNLERCFRSNEWINVRFSRSEVQKAGSGGELYGVQIQQDWCSSSYGDRGYLFLALDMNDPDSTLIQIRTWQPHPDPVDGLFDLSSF